jgi:hypothetical protein
MNTEIKYGGVVRRENKLFIVIYTNVKLAVKQELGCERYAQYEAKEDWDDEFIQLIVKLHTCPYSAKHLLAYAQFYEYDITMLRHAPITTTKKEILDGSLPTPERFILKLKADPYSFFPKKDTPLEERYFHDVNEDRYGINYQCLDLDHTKIPARLLTLVYKWWGEVEGEDSKFLTEKRLSKTTGELVRKNRKTNKGASYDITEIKIRNSIVTDNSNSDG